MTKIAKIGELTNVDSAGNEVVMYPFTKKECITDLGVATTTSSGLMSSIDKKNVDYVANDLKTELDNILGAPSEGINHNHDDRYYTKNQIDEKITSTIKTITLLASGWVGNQYTITDSLVTLTSNQMIMRALTMTTEQAEAYNLAEFSDGGQSNGRMVIKALGTVPTINIPIRVMFSMSLLESPRPADEVTLSTTNASGTGIKFGIDSNNNYGFIPQGKSEVTPFGFVYPNAGSHNSIFRGKNLGTSVTLEQYASIANGTFDDLFVGDYWNIEGVNWRIAGFDYFLKTGDTELTKHHVVIVPDTSLYVAKMNNTNTTNGGYVGSDMYKTGLNQAKEQIKRIFAGHVVNHRERLCNATSNGNPRGSIWVDSEVELLCETMLYGTKLFSPLPNGVTIIDNYNVGNSQLPLFALNHSYVCNRQNLWLRDIVANECFAFANDFGDCYYDYSSASQGVRPYFLIG